MLWFQNMNNTWLTKIDDIKFDNTTTNNLKQLYNLSNEINLVEELKNGIYKIVMNNNKKYILKFNRMKRITKKKSRLSAFATSIYYNKTFQNEILVNELLKALPSHSLNFPDMLYYNNNLIVFDYIDNLAKYSNSDMYFNSDIIEFIAIFKRLECSCCDTRFNRILNSLFDFVFYLRNFMVAFLYKYRDKKAPNYYFKYLIEIIKHYHKSGYSLNHNDLSANIFISEGKLYVLDFEGSSTSKFYCEDIVSCAIDLNTFEINVSLFNDFFNNIVDYDNNYLINNFREELRLILIRSCVRGIRSETKSLKYKENLYNFFKDILFKDKDYLKWYEEKIGKHLLISLDTNR